MSTKEMTKLKQLYERTSDEGLLDVYETLVKQGRNVDLGMFVAVRREMLKRMGGES